MSEPSPEDLLSAIAGGSRESFSTLYDHFSASLFGIAYGVTRNHAEAQEILQEAFLAIWNKADRYDPKLGKATTWLIQVTRNLAIDHLRKRQRQDAGRERLRDEPSHEGSPKDPAGRLISKEAAARVRQALADLPDDQRHALELAFFRGMSQSQIAEHLHEPLGTVKSRIRRAMERVRSVVTDLAQDVP